MNPSFALAWHYAGKLPVRTIHDEDTGAPSFHLEVLIPPVYMIEHRLSLDTLPYVDFDVANGMAVYTVESGGAQYEVHYKAIEQRELTVLFELADIKALNS